MIRYKCGNCAALMESPATLQGQTETCPSCGLLVRVPVTVREKAIRSALAVGSGLTYLPLMVATDIVSFLSLAAGMAASALIHSFWLLVTVLGSAVVFLALGSFWSKHFRGYVFDLLWKSYPRRVWVMPPYFALRVIQLGLTAIIGMLFIRTSWMWKFYLPWMIIGWVIGIVCASRMPKQPEGLRQ